MVDKGSGFCNRSENSWFQDNDLERHSAYKEGKSVADERFIRILKNKVYKCMFSMLKKWVYIDEIADIINEYNNTYHRAIKMKL